MLRDKRAAGLYFIFSYIKITILTCLNHNDAEIVFMGNDYFMYEDSLQSPSKKKLEINYEIYSGCWFVINIEQIDGFLLCHLIPISA